MRKPSSKLHQLIQSLSKEEKRKVTIRINELGKKGVEHLRLFKLISKQKTYNETNLKRLFKGNALSIEKKRLEELIIEALVEFHHTTTIEQELLLGLQKFHVLFNKGLYDQAKETIYALKELAVKQELLYYVQLINEELIKLEHRVYFFSDYTDDSFSEFLNLLKLQQDQANNLSSYILLKAQMHYLFRQKVITPEYTAQLKGIINCDFLKTLDWANSVSAKLHFCQIHLSYNFLNVNHSKSLFYSLKALSIFEKHFQKIRPPEEYMDYLHNTLTIATVNRKNDIVIELFQKMNQNNLLITKNQTLFELRALELKANWYICIEDLESGQVLIEKNSQWVEQCKLDNSPVLYCFSNICINSKQYDRALSFLDMILEKSNAQNKLKHLALLIKLYIYFDTKNYSLLESHTRSIYRKFYLNKENHTVELIIVSTFRRLLKSNKEEDLILLKNLYEKITHFSITAVEHEVRIIKNSRVLQWLETKLKKQSIAGIT